MTQRIYLDYAATTPLAPDVAQAMLTVPLIGWVAKLGANRSILSSFSVGKYGAQCAADPYDPDAGDGLKTDCNTDITGNDPNDAYVTDSTAAEQKLIPLEDGSAVILTVAYYYTPSGKAIIVDGVVPTVQVVLPTPDVDDEAAATAPVPPPVKEPSLTDPVIKKALDLLKAGTAPGAQKAA